MDTHIFALAQTASGCRKGGIVFRPERELELRACERHAEKFHEREIALYFRQVLGPWKEALGIGTVAAGRIEAGIYSRGWPLA
jgi:hypothetical protein